MARLPQRGHVWPGRGSSGWELMADYQADPARFQRSFSWAPRRPRPQGAPPRGRSGRPAPRPDARLPADVIEGVSKGCRPQQVFASCTDAVLDYVPGAGHGQGREHRTTSSGALFGGACAVSRLVPGVRLGGMGSPDRTRCSRGKARCSRGPGSSRPRNQQDQASLIHHASPAFWSCYHTLPEPTQKLADQAYERLKQDPRHPSLHFKKTGRFWSARVGGQHRALAVEAVDG